MWTNETINIWSHLLTFFVFFILMIYFNAVHLPAHNGGMWDHVIINVSFSCSFICMLASSGYHTFHCQPSEAPYCKWHVWDINGIAITLYGGHLSAMHYMFYCKPTISLMYLVIGLCILSSIIHSSLYIPSKLDKCYEKMLLKHKIKIAGLSAFSLISVIPFLGGNGLQNEYANLILPMIIKFYIFLLIGMFIYMVRIPECLFPGTVDYIGNSHNWWHLFVSLSALYFFLNIHSAIEYAEIQGCPSDFDLA